jgi:L-seryl-tRNA(Ser) seleniumtransferase
MQNPLRSFPSVNELLENPRLAGLVNRVSRNVVVSNAVSFLDHLRDQVQAATADLRVPSAAELAERVADWIQYGTRTELRPVINATGVLLHPELGRAPLAKEAIQAMSAAAGYVNLELNLDTGESAPRNAILQKLLQRLTGAEAALAVNNDAAAMLLALTALAANKEVIVARGQLPETAGRYRLPEIAVSSGARLREVGTTNKCRIEDYEAAIGPNTAALLRVQSSDYSIVGGVEEATLGDLVTLGRRRNLPVIDDVGSGALIDFGRYGIHGERLISTSVQNGADLVLFSGDRLLGGPQAGIVVGRKSWVQRLADHALERALQVDKITLAGLVATLQLYRDVATAEEAIPLLSRLSTPVDNLRNRAERLAPQLAAAPSITAAEPMEAVTYLAGVPLPSQQLPTWCILLKPKTLKVPELTAALRAGSPSVLVRREQEQLLLDLRSVHPSQDALLVEAVGRVGGTPPATTESASPSQAT